MAKVSVDKNKCIGCGACVAICEKTFVLSGGKVKVKAQPKSITCEKEAADSCPVEAISVQ